MMTFMLGRIGLTPQLCQTQAAMFITIMSWQIGITPVAQAWSQSSTAHSHYMTQTTTTTDTDNLITIHRCPLYTFIFVFHINVTILNYNDSNMRIDHQSC